MNFTASYITFNDIEITDELGHPITTLKKTKRVYPFKFKKPKIFFDILSEGKEPEIIETRDVNFLDDCGVVLHVVPVTKHERWLPTQRRRYKLFLRESIQKEGKQLSSTPKDTYFLYDKANGAVKLIGPLVSPMGESEWLFL